MPRTIHLRTAAAATWLVCACNSVDIDESDHDVFFVDARVRKHFDKTDDHHGPFGELGWTAVHGDTDQLEYKIGLLNVGGGWEQPLGANFSIAGSAGLAKQYNDFDATAGPLNDDDSFGFYGAFEGGWRPAKWFEPCARIATTLALDEWSSSDHFEIGARLHFVEHAALFVGWRQVHYEIEDIDSGLNVSTLELDLSGAVVSLLVSF